MRRPQVLLGAAMTLLAAATVAADARGKVALRGATFTVADAVAYTTEDGIEVALLPAPLDRKAAARDLKLNSFDIMRTGKAYITLKIGKDGAFNCIDYSEGSGGGSSCNSDFSKGLKLTARTDARVAGSFRMKDGADSADVTFDLKVESALPRPGVALPPDGGEPGAAVLAHFVAIEKNDFKALKATAQPEQLKMMEAAEKSGEAKDLFKMMREMSPRKVKVLGGTVDGDSAIVDFEGVAEGKPMKGTAECVRIAGRWYMTGMSN